MAYIMEYMTVKDMEEALKKIKTVIIPYGCIEQHGYHLPLSTDMYITEVAIRAADRLDAIIAPAVPYTFSGGELPGKDFHAGCLETSLMMYWKPELVRKTVELDEPFIAGMMRTDPDWYALVEKDGNDGSIIPKIRQREGIKVGVMGFPEKANRELGEKLSREMEDGLVEYIRMLNERVKTMN